MILHSKILVGSNKNILILHGFLGSGDNWISIARKLNQLGHTVHLVDQRNHGRSFHSEKFDYNLMCEDLFNYIRHHNINNSILIGHSMGGKTAMNFSLIHPNWSLNSLSWTHHQGDIQSYIKILLIHLKKLT